MQAFSAAEDRPRPSADHTCQVTRAGLASLSYSKQIYITFEVLPWRLRDALRIVSGTVNRDRPGLPLSVPLTERDTLDIRERILASEVKDSTLDRSSTFIQTGASKSTATGARWSAGTCRATRHWSVGVRHRPAPSGDYAHQAARASSASSRSSVTM